MQIPPLIKQLARSTGLLFVIFLVATILPGFVDFPARYQSRLLHGLTWIAAVALFFQAAIWANVFVVYWSGKYIAKHGTDPGDAMTIRTVAILIKVLLWTILAVNIVWVFFQTNLTGLIAGLGVGGIAIAFALQNILADLFASLSIVIDKPFVIGDAIQVDTLSGRVERIGLKSTRIRSDSGEQIVFGNGELLKGRIRNFGRLEERQTVIVTKVAGSTPPDRLERIPGVIREIVQQRPGTRFVRSTLTSFSDSTIDFTTIYYITSPSYQLYAETQQAVLLALLRRLERDEVRLGVQVEAAFRENGPAGIAPAAAPPLNS